MSKGTMTVNYKQDECDEIWISTWYLAGVTEVNKHKTNLVVQGSVVVSAQNMIVRWLVISWMMQAHQCLS